MRVPIPRKRLAGRLRFTPRTEGSVVWCDFEGEGFLTPLLAGTVLPKAMVPPAGLERWKPCFKGRRFRLDAQVVA